MNSGDLSSTLTESHQTHDRDIATFFFVSREHSKMNYENFKISSHIRLSEKLISWRRLNRLSKLNFWSLAKINDVQTHGTDLHFLPLPKPHPD